MAELAKEKRRDSGTGSPLKSLRAAVIGLGVGEAHALAYNAIEGCEVAALCDLKQDRLAEISAKYPAAFQTTRAEEILERDDIDIVSIASFDNAHFEQTIKAIDHNKHIFIEKPLCMTPEEMRQIHTKLKAKPDLKMSSNLILRTSPRFCEVKRMMQEGLFGRLCGIEGEYLYGRKHKITEGWRGEIDWYSVTFGGSVHLIDLMIWFAGERVTEVVSMGNQIATEGTQFRHPDLISSLLKFESGAVGKVTANFGCVHPHFHSMQVHGTKASFFHTPEEGRLYDQNKDLLDWKTLDQPYPGVKKGDLLEDFIYAIREDREPRVSKKDVFDVMSICFAIEESLRANKSVKVNYLEEI